LSKDNDADKAFSGDDCDWLLIEQFKKGDIDAFRELFDKHKVNVINLSYRFLQNREAAEDVAQEVFIKIYEKKICFNPKAKFTTWLYRVTVNASVDRTRKKSFSEKSLEESQEDIRDPSTESPKEAFHKKELKEQIQAQIQKLPEDLKKAIVLYQFEELSYQQIAQTLQISSKAVERRIYHAKEALRKALII